MFTARIAFAHADAPTWGLGAEAWLAVILVEDQQLGGLIMWVPGGTAYVIAALALAGRWFSAD